MQPNLYRFRKVAVESNPLLKGESSWYEIRDGEGHLRRAVHVIGNCLGGTTTFHRDLDLDDPSVIFRLEPKRKIMNLTYYVFESVLLPMNE
ncbi:MAG: hypothetical protein C0616_11275 [Desulfuromonas sp.]|nr:MAG: hypothetical protein C0616_11275 [Desulfuromonas sp.]